MIMIMTNLLNIKMILGKLGMSSIDKKKSSFASHFIINTSTVTEKPIIANKFNEYFCEIGPKSIPSPRNPHINFQSNLGTPVWIILSLITQTQKK